MAGKGVKRLCCAVYTRESSAEGLGLRSPRLVAATLAALVGGCRQSPRASLIQL